MSRAEKSEMRCRVHKAGRSSFRTFGILDRKRARKVHDRMHRRMQNTCTETFVPEMEIPGRSSSLPGLSLGVYTETSLNLPSYKFQILWHPLLPRAKPQIFYPTIPARNYLAPILAVAYFARDW